MVSNHSFQLPVSLSQQKKWIEKTSLNDFLTNNNTNNVLTVEVNV